MSVKFKFKIYDTSNRQPIWPTLRMLLEIESLEKTVTEYEIEQGFHSTHSAKGLVSGLLETQIKGDTGLANIKVSKFFFDEDKYLIDFPDDESYTLFKLFYYGANV